MMQTQSDSAVIKWHKRFVEGGYGLDGDHDRTVATLQLKPFGWFPETFYFQTVFKDCTYRSTS